MSSVPGMRRPESAGRASWSPASGVMAVAVALCVSFIGSASAGTSSTKAKKEPPYTFVVSNNFLGNDWRPQVEKLAQLTVEAPAVQGQGQRQDRQLRFDEPGADRRPEQHHPDEARRDHADPGLQHRAQPDHPARVRRGDPRLHDLGAGDGEVRLEREPGLLRRHEGRRSVDGQGAQEPGLDPRRSGHRRPRHLEGHRERLPWPA